MTILGCIADDLTGAADLADALVRAGMRTMLSVGIPGDHPGLDRAEAIVIALKIRTAEADTAIAESRAALASLRARKARQIFFKYCSTFDSTDRGNIGPVADALLVDLQATFTVACPAFPANQRTIYQGHLFVGDRLLSESSMRQHPLTPMTDSDLVRVLARQVRGTVGLVSHDVVRRGSGAISTAFNELAENGFRYAVVDAIENDNILDIVAACADLALVTGASGLGGGLPGNFRRQGLLSGEPGERLPAVGGHAAIIAGSCSQATLSQIEEFRKDGSAVRVDALALADYPDLASVLAEKAESCLDKGPILVYSSTSPEEVAHIQATIGREKAGSIIEQSLAEIAAHLVDAGVRRMVIAGGETTGAVIQRLGLKTFHIGPRIAPGVPWTRTVDEPAMLIAMKSGNFGGRDFFRQALEMVR